MSILQQVLTGADTGFIQMAGAIMLLRDQATSPELRAYLSDCLNRVARVEAMCQDVARGKALSAIERDFSDGPDRVHSEWRGAMGDTLWLYHADGGKVRIQREGSPADSTVGNTGDIVKLLHVLGYSEVRA